MNFWKTAARRLQTPAVPNPLPAPARASQATQTAQPAQAGSTRPPDYERSKFREARLPWRREA